MIVHGRGCGDRRTETMGTHVSLVAVAALCLAGECMYAIIWLCFRHVRQLPVPSQADRAVWSGAGSYGQISGGDPCAAKGLTMCNGREAENKTAGPCYNKTISKCCPDSGESYSFAPAVCALSQECCQGAYGNATCYTPPELCCGGMMAFTCKNGSGTASCCGDGMRGWHGCCKADETCAGAQGYDYHCAPAFMRAGPRDPV